MTFTLIPPTAPETPLIVEVPHAGLIVDPESMAHLVAPARSIGQDADLYVDTLFQDAPSLGAHLLYGHMSRYVTDLNRAEDDLDAMTTPSGTSASSPHGVVWRKTTEGRPAILAPLSGVEIARRLESFYRPYHEALYALIQGKLERFGVALLLCGHSMPSFGRLGERRADIVPGSRGRTSAGPSVLAACEDAAQSAGYDLAHDTPYSGGFTTTRYGSPGSGVHALQIEIARRLYMDENTLSLKPGSVEGCRAFCRDLVRRLSELHSADLAAS